MNHTIELSRGAREKSLVPYAGSLRVTNRFGQVGYISSLGWTIAEARANVAWLKVCYSWINFKTSWGSLDMLK